MKRQAAPILFLHIVTYLLRIYPLRTCEGKYILREFMRYTLLFGKCHEYECQINISIKICVNEFYYYVVSMRYR